MQCLSRDMGLGLPVVRQWPAGLRSFVLEYTLGGMYNAQRVSLQPFVEALGSAPPGLRVSLCANSESAVDGSHRQCRHCCGDAPSVVDHVRPLAQQGRLAVLRLLPCAGLGCEGASELVDADWKGFEQVRVQVAPSARFLPRRDGRGTNLRTFLLVLAGLKRCPAGPLPQLVCEAWEGWVEG